LTDSTPSEAAQIAEPDDGIAAMCRWVDQPMLVSEAFANVDGMRGSLVSVGRYASPLTVLSVMLLS